MIKLFDILPELKTRPSGYKFVEGDYIPRTQEELREIESLTILEVTGGLFLGNTQITRLPDNVKVGGSIDLMFTEITRLPNNFKVGRSLYLNETPITKLPDKLEVVGSLYLNETPITELPDKLEVGGDLILSNTPLAEKYTEYGIERMIVRQGGSIGGEIITV